MFTILAALSPPGVPAMAFSLPHQEIKGQNKVGKRDKSDEGASRFAQTRLNGLRSWKMRDAYDRHHAQNGKNATEIRLLALRHSANSGIKTQHQGRSVDLDKTRPG
ncbi:hypothetical protein LZ32DRAFT_662397 [Colletotrichum eremochloae]|nr:hypothetical protein LZ32DRAFT_662397 [Colletotrichum eremochloae]